jgi:hypothetical protein
MDQPIDRGEVDRSSLEATERLRARLVGQPVATARRRRPVLPWVIAAAVLTFALGLIANPWFEQTVRSQLPFVQPAPVADAARLAALDARIAQVEAGAGRAAAMPVERLAATEARMTSTSGQIARDAERIDALTRDMAALSAKVETNGTRIASLAEATTVAADRAQAVLVVQLVRRAVDAGRPIGPLDAPLRQSFEARYPAAVQAVSALGATPVTLASLRRDLETVRARVNGGPASAGTAGGKGWFEIFADTIGGAFASAPAQPTAATVDPLAAAAQALARNDAGAAAVQLRRLPDRTRGFAAAWLAAADRFRAGTEGLATLETATALLPPTLPSKPAG